MTEAAYVRRIKTAAEAYIKGLGSADMPPEVFENWQRIRAGLSPFTVAAMCDAYLEKDDSACASQEGSEGLDLECPQLSFGASALR